MAAAYKAAAACFTATWKVGIQTRHRNTKQLQRHLLVESGNLVAPFLAIPLLCQTVGFESMLSILLVCQSPAFASVSL